MSEKRFLKFAVSYSRKVSTAPYESMDISLWMESLADKDPDALFKEVVDRVERWIRQRLREIEAEEEPMEP